MDRFIKVSFLAFGYFLAFFVYVTIWQVFFGYQSVSSSGVAQNLGSVGSVGTSQNINMYTGASAVVSGPALLYFSGFIPIYSTVFGNLIMYDILYLVLSAVPFLYLSKSLFSTVKKSQIENRDENRVELEKSFESPAKGSAIKGDYVNIPTQKTPYQKILPLWALIGFLAFIGYNLIGFFDVDTSTVLISLFALVMWIAFFASIVLLILPKLRRRGVKRIE